MSYDLDIVQRDAVPIDLDTLRDAVTSIAPAVVARVQQGRLVVDGAGFTVMAGGKGVHLSAGTTRGPADERAMEIVALQLAGAKGVVFDRHTGRQWPVELLSEWLRVAGLFSGRALALNEERIAHRTDHTAAKGFAERVDALVAHLASGNASPALRARLHDELAYYATRPALVWSIARSLAGLGDFDRLEALTRAAPAESEVNAFQVAAEYGRAALPLFARALGDPDPNYRRAAARALHLIVHPEVLPLIARALEDKRSTVREAVLEVGFEQVLALDGARVALARVLSRLASDSSSLVRKMSSKWSG